MRVSIEAKGEAYLSEQFILIQSIYQASKLGISIQEAMASVFSFNLTIQSQFKQTQSSKQAVSDSLVVYS